LYVNLFYFYEDAVFVPIFSGVPFVLTSDLRSLFSFFTYSAHEEELVFPLLQC
jgi:hypothetical protein